MWANSAISLLISVWSTQNTSRKIISLRINPNEKSSRQQWLDRNVRKCFWMLKNFEPWKIHPVIVCLQIKDCVYFVLKGFERYDTSSDSSCAVGLVKALGAKQLGFSVDVSIPWDVIHVLSNLVKLWSYKVWDLRSMIRDEAGSPSCYLHFCKTFTIKI